MAEIPGWAVELCDEVLACIEGLTFFDIQYYAPDKHTLESHLIEVAPVKLEIAEAGERDGEEIFDPNFNIDLLALKGVFGTVRSFYSAIDHKTQSRMLMMEGTYRRRTIFLNIRTVPFEDAEIVGRVRPGGKYEFFHDMDGEE